MIFAYKRCIACIYEGWAMKEGKLNSNPKKERENVAGDISTDRRVHLIPPTIP